MRARDLRGTAAALLLLGLLMACASGARGGAGGAPEAAADRMAWWREARFGLFLHWGLYAIPAGEWDGRTTYGEWILESAHIPVADYEHLVERFDPVRFDARAWARAARRAGMRYVVITTKHHDGFCLFRSDQTDYDVASTPFGRDVMREVADAFRAEGLRIGWYHSIMDWHHPDYLPRRSWEDRPADGADFERYVAYLHAQVEELLTRYGPIDVMWFDGEWEGTWTHERGLALYEHCRRLAPDVIVNNRVDKGRGGMAGLTVDSRYAGDFGTPEQEVPATGFPGVDWESCMTMNDNWGYNAHDDAWKSPAVLVRTLVETASKGGNLLLNVGPTALGELPPEALERLDAMGAWMAVNGGAIYGTSASPFDELPWGRCTRRSFPGGTRLFLSVFDWPEDGRLVVPDLGNRPLGAHTLADPAHPLMVQRAGDDLVIAVPATPPDPLVSVVVLEVEGEPLVFRAPGIEAEVEAFVHPLPVRLSPGSPGLSVRYTLDGSEPGPGSPVATEEVVLEDSCLVRARSFHGGRGVGPEVQRRFERVEPLPAVDPGAVAPGLQGTLYRGDWDELPDLDRVEPAERWDQQRFGLAPPARAERVALRLRGWIRVPVDDVYRFALTSDDGSALDVDGRRVVDNDGLHGPEEAVGAVALAAGAHAFEVRWFNKTGGAELELAWGRPGTKLVPATGEDFLRPRIP